MRRRIVVTCFEASPLDCGGEAAAATEVPRIFG